MVKKIKREEYLVVKVNEAEKELIEKAAKNLGMTMSTFVRTNMLDVARKTV